LKSVNRLCTEQPGGSTPIGELNDWFVLGIKGRRKEAME